MDVMGQVTELHDRGRKRVADPGQTLYKVDDYAGNYADRPYAGQPTHVDRATQVAIASGSSFELFAGLIAGTIAIIAIVGYYPIFMVPTATIAVGFALLAQGGTMAARWQKATRIVGSERTHAVGIGTEVFGGLAGITLGLLALFGVAPLWLCPIAALVLGFALLLGGPAQPQIAEAAPAVSEQRWHVTRDVVRTSSGVMVMAGVAAIVLGILALVAGGPVLLLSSIAMLCIAAALVLAGGALTARFSRRFA